MTEVLFYNRRPPWIFGLHARGLDALVRSDAPVIPHYCTYLPRMLYVG